MDPALAPASGVITFKILVSNDQAGAIIGKSGAQITALQETKNVFVKLGGPEDLFPGTFYRAAVVRGEVSCVRNALADISDILWKDYSARRDVLADALKNPSLISTADSGEELVKSGPSISESTIMDMSLHRYDGDTGDAASGTGIHDFVVRLLVPDNSSGAVIGKGGKTVRALAEQTGAHVKLSSNDMKHTGVMERAVLVSGSHPAVRAAVLKIFDIMCAEARNLVYANPTVSYARQSYIPHHAEPAFYAPGPSPHYGGGRHGAPWMGDMPAYYDGSTMYTRGLVGHMPPGPPPGPPPLPPMTGMPPMPTMTSMGPPAHGGPHAPGYGGRGPQPSRGHHYAYHGEPMAPRGHMRGGRHPPAAYGYPDERQRFSRGPAMRDHGGYPGHAYTPAHYATAMYPGYAMDRPMAADHGLSSSSAYADVGHGGPVPTSYGMAGYQLDARAWSEAAEFGGSKPALQNDRSTPSPHTMGSRSPSGAPSSSPSNLSTAPSRRSSVMHPADATCDYAIAQAVELEDRSSGASARPPSPLSTREKLIMSKSLNNSNRSLGGGSRLEPVLERDSLRCGSDLVASSPAPAIQPLHAAPGRKYPTLVRGASDTALIRSQDAVGSSLIPDPLSFPEAVDTRFGPVPSLPQPTAARVRTLLGGPYLGVPGAASQDANPAIDIADMLSRFSQVST